MNQALLANILKIAASTSISDRVWSRLPINPANTSWTPSWTRGCIRMRNEDVIDLYERVKVGAKVVVL